MGEGATLSPVVVAEADAEGVAEGVTTTSSSVVAHTSLLDNEGPVAEVEKILKQYSVSAVNPLSCNAVSFTCGAGETEDHPVRI